MSRERVQRLGNIYEGVFGYYQVPFPKRRFDYYDYYVFNELTRFLREIPPPSNPDTNTAFYNVEDGIEDYYENICKDKYKGDSKCIACANKWVENVRKTHKTPDNNDPLMPGCEGFGQVAGDYRADIAIYARRLLASNCEKYKGDRMKQEHCVSCRQSMYSKLDTTVFDKGVIVHNTITNPMKRKCPKEFAELILNTCRFVVALRMKEVFSDGRDVCMKMDIRNPIDFAHGVFQNTTTFQGKCKLL